MVRTSIVDSGIGFLAAISRGQSRGVLLPPVGHLRATISGSSDTVRIYKCIVSDRHGGNFGDRAGYRSISATSEEMTACDRTYCLLRDDVEQTMVSTCRRGGPLTIDI
jgi:hypothetical protein